MWRVSMENKRIWNYIVWIKKKNNNEFVNHLWVWLKIYFLVFCIYKMYLISAKGYKNAGVDLLLIKKADEIWTKMKDIQNGLGVHKISDLVLKEIYGIYKIKSLTKEQIKRYKMTKRKTFEKFDNLSKDELNTKSKKGVYVKNDVMTTVVKGCRGEKKEAKEK